MSLLLFAAAARCFVQIAENNVENQTIYWISA